MTDTSIGERIHEYIRDEILLGTDAGLSPATPLLELGILDSFALLGLVAHLNRSFGIDLGPDEITGHDFKTIESISRLVARRLRPQPAQSSRADGAAVDGAAVFEAPACAQLFIFFTGLSQDLVTGRRVADWPVSRFFTESGLTDRNVIAFGDPYGQSYRLGVSDALPTPARICAWLQQWIGAHRHIDEVYCVGISSGGPIAMAAGEYLKARTVWAFGPRPVQGEFANTVPNRLLHMVEEATGKTLAQLEREMTGDDRDKIDAFCTPQALDRYYNSFLDPAIVLDRAHLAELAALLSHPNGVTRHHLLYCPRDVCDALVAERLRGCPTVTIVEVRPSKARPRPWAFSRWVPPVDWIMRDHIVADLLLKRRQLGRLFPPFRPVRRMDFEIVAPGLGV